MVTKKVEIPEFDNIWTKIGASKLRGNKVFKGVWRGVKVLVAYAVLGGITQVAGASVPAEYQPLYFMLATALEKWSREYADKSKLLKSLDI